MKNGQNKNVVLPRLLIATIIVCLALFTFHQEAFAGITGKIAGTVIDIETGERLPMANCMIVGTEMGAACDAEGDYFIINIPPGTYSLQVRMMGYESVTKTGIEVDADHTTEVDFELRPVAVEVPGITIVAKREIVKMDMSSSELVAEIEEIDAVPLVTDVREFINLQAGIQGWEIRGGGFDQSTFMLDGLMLVDNRTNQPITRPNLSSIEEFSVIKGGFNAEYGNVRSGVINIITKEGSPEKYHGSINFQYTPAHYKHRGPDLYDWDNFYLRPYLEEEDSVCWLGTEVWPDSLQEIYREFMGWVAYSEMLMGDADTTNDMTPEQARNLFIWQHMADGCEEFGQTQTEYGHRPDWYLDVGFGGPVPFTNGNLTFYSSYKTNKELFGLPTSREYYEDENAQLKLTYRLTPDMKLTLEGLYGETKSVAGNLISPAYGYLESGDDIFNTTLCASQLAWEHYRSGQLYFPSSLPPFDVYRTMGGMNLEHALSPNTFYSLRFTYSNVKHWSNGPDRWRDTTKVACFGNVCVDEQPHGCIWDVELDETIAMMVYTKACAGMVDLSTGNTLNLKGDITSQIDKYNQIKAGFEYNYDNMNTNTERWTWHEIDHEYYVWDHYPIRASAYLQDKLEFEGMIANFGVRIDYSNPNCDWYTVDRYDPAFKLPTLEEFMAAAQIAPAKSHLVISPRFGISHPISEVSKIYFNYGHFYSMAPSEALYDMRTKSPAHGYGIEVLGNPSAELPKTVAYELGYEHNIADLLLLHIAGYYKNVTNQTGWVYYTNYYGTIDYRTIENNNYEDIRGFEVTLRKQVGPWVTGFINYDYMVSTSGHIGREHYYEDPRQERIYGMQNPEQEKALPRPLWRALLKFTTPEDWGLIFGGFNLSFLYSWRSGSYFTWDPLITYELEDNLQWKPYTNIDLRFTKDITYSGMRFSVYLDVFNLFDWKHLDMSGFSTSEDYENYLESLHLPLYKEEGYEAYEGGNDQPGDVKSKSKSYIDMPNREFLTYFDPRTITFGIRFYF